MSDAPAGTAADVTCAVGEDGIALLWLGDLGSEQARNAIDTLGRLGDLLGVLVVIDSGAAAAGEAGAARRTLQALEQLAPPTAAVSLQSCVDAELEAALACRYRLVAGGRGIRLGFPGVRLGSPARLGAARRLPALVGLVQALPLLTQGALRTTPEARRLGLVDAVLPAERPLEAARAWLLTRATDPVAATRPRPSIWWHRWVERFAPLRAHWIDRAARAVHGAASHAPAHVLASVQAAYDTPGEAAAAVEAHWHAAPEDTELQRLEMLRQSLLVPEDAPPDRVIVTGSGPEAGPLVYALARHGIDVLVHGPEPQQLRRQMAAFARCNTTGSRGDRARVLHRVTPVGALPNTGAPRLTTGAADGAAALRCWPADDLPKVIETADVSLADLVRHLGALPLITEGSLLAPIASAREAAPDPYRHHAVANACAKALEEDDSLDAAVLDLAVVDGLGFPQYQGGPLRWADRQGVAPLVRSLKRLAREHLADLFEPAPLLQDLARRNGELYAG